MAKSDKNLFIKVDEINGLYCSLFLKHIEINNNISEQDDNLVFINYEGMSFDNKDMSPLLSIYFDSESKFARFSLINSAPKNVSRKNVASLVDALNKNYVLMSYEYSESDGNFYITGEYWLNYKYGLDPSVIPHLIYSMPSILSGALSSELQNLR
jgi:hypothetical protein